MAVEETVQRSLLLCAITMRPRFDHLMTCSTLNNIQSRDEDNYYTVFTGTLIYCVR